MNKTHEPVMTEEVIKALFGKAHLNTRFKAIDATLGSGGHTLAMLKNGAEVLGIEADSDMLGIARERIKKEAKSNDKFTLVHGNFKDIKKIAGNNGFEKVSAVLFDLGISNIQLTDSKRGFSFMNRNGDLDMRIDPSSQAVTGKMLINVLREDQLKKMFEGIIPYESINPLIKLIISKRETEGINNAGDLIDIADGVIKEKKVNSATKVFMALRIAVNSEIENTEIGITDAFELLGKEGKMAVITFHSLEDGLVKRTFRKIENEERGKILNKKPIKPSEEEVRRNAKSRSAKLRIIEKI